MSWYNEAGTAAFRRLAETPEARKRMLDELTEAGFQNGDMIDDIVDYDMSKLSTETRGVLRALERDDFLGFDNVDQALHTVFSEGIDAYEPSPGLKSAVGRLVNSPIAPPKTRNIPEMGVLKANGNGGALSDVMYDALGNTVVGGARAALRDQAREDVYGTIEPTSNWRNTAENWMVDNLPLSRGQSRSLLGLSDFLPAIGTGTAIADAADSYKNDDMVGTAINAGAAALDLIPGKVVSAPFKRGAGAIREIIAGPAARNAPTDALARAIELDDAMKSRNYDALERGRSVSTTTNEELGTSTFVGEDGVPRWEIDDSQAYIDDESLQEMIEMTKQTSGGEPVRMTMDMDMLLGHKALYENYPQLAETQITATRGLGDTIGARYPDGSITLNMDAVEEGKDPLSTLLHETQHNVQGIEGMARGGNPLRASDDALEAEALRTKALEESGAIERARQYQAARQERLGLLAPAERIASYNNYSANPPRPGMLTNQGNWYSGLGDQIRGTLGPMPKAPGTARDQWQSKAWQMMADEEYNTVFLDKGQAYADEVMAAANSPDIHKRVRNNKRLMDSTLNDYKGVQLEKDRVVRRNGALEEVRRAQGNKGVDFYNYQTGLGEVEARAVQARMGLTPEQRAARPVVDDYTFGRILMQPDATASQTLPIRPFDLYVPPKR